MSGGLEAAADAATGGLIAHAVDRAPGGGGHGADAHGTCLNCGTALIGAHCHACGQAGHVHRTIGAIGHELAHGVFHFEGRIWKTLPMLVLRPGELTRRYIAGERVRFVTPLAIFLFSVFLMFAVVANLPSWSLMGGDFLKSGVTGGMEEARTKLAEETVKATEAIAEAERRLAAARRDETPDAERIARLGERVATARKARADLVAAQAMLPKSTGVQEADDPAGDNWLEARFRHARENPKLLLYKMKTSAYKYGWALIPISLPFIWLLFPFRRDVGMYDHAVFATYSLSFMSFLVIALALLSAIGVSWTFLSLAATIIVPLHMYKQLKGAYRLSRIGALWRTAWMLVFAMIAITLFTILLVYLGVAD